MPYAGQSAMPRWERAMQLLLSEDAATFGVETTRTAPGRISGYPNLTLTLIPPGAGLPQVRLDVRVYNGWKTIYDSANPASTDATYAANTPIEIRRRVAASQARVRFGAGAGAITYILSATA